MARLPDGGRALPVFLCFCERMKTFLAIEGLVRHFGGTRAVDGLDLTLAEGGLLCIIGPNGCGKTTLFNLICGELRSQAGTIRLQGRDLTRLKPHEIARHGVIRKFQMPSVYDGLSIGRNLLLALNAPLLRRNLTPDLYELAAMAGFSAADMDRPAGELPHGRKQWLEIAMVLGAGPQLLLLDEPTAGMTREETAMTVRLIRDIHARYGVAMIMIEHDMGFVEQLGCDVAVMMHGRVITRGGFDDVRRVDAVREAYLGASA